MEQQVKTANNGHRFWSPIVGAALGLVIGNIFIWQGFLAGLIVLVMTVLGALAGRYYAARE